MDAVADRSVDPGSSGVVPFRFACHRCGHCCSGGSGHVWLEAHEVERMAAVVGATTEKFVQRFVREAVDPRDGSRRLALKETEAHGGRCALLVGRNTCSVYDARPAHCRTFPYWDSVMTDPVAFESARSTCPGIAVEVDAAVKQRAFAQLARLHASLEPTIEPATCCLDAGTNDAATNEGRVATDAVIFATALEVDYALARTAERAGSCRLGDRRPLACRTIVASGADSDDNVSVSHTERNLRELRDIERACGYPASYAALADLLRAREASAEAAR